ncbi:MAG: hypothetical protein JKY46_10995 [Robiginitomaculum sp.]|nr:hypothetical protein [Robiginitomaculum sp.]
MSSASSMLVDLRLSVLACDSQTARVLTALDSDHRTRKLPVFSVDIKNFDTPQKALRQQLGKALSSQLPYLEQVAIGVENGRLVCDLLGLVADRNAFRLPTCDWWPLFELFPWEDWRKCTPKNVTEVLLPQLYLQADKQKQKLDIIGRLFGQNGFLWHSENIDQRFEMLYQAGLLPEALRDRSGAKISVRHHHVAVFGQTMLGKDRLQLAKSLSRLRQLLLLRPVLNYLLLAPFSLGDLLKTIENISGVGLHTQNFRRDILRGGAVKDIGAIRSTRTGRPAKLYNWSGPLYPKVSNSIIPMPRKKCGC